MCQLQRCVTVQKKGLQSALWVQTATSGPTHSTLLAAKLTVPTDGHRPKQVGAGPFGVVPDAYAPPLEREASSG